MDFNNFTSMDLAKMLDGMHVTGASLGPKSCAVCRSKTSLLLCGSCKVVHYCGPAHQSAHRPKHKSACVSIKKSQEKLEREEAALRAHPGDMITPADVFENGVGRFWGILDTRDYMRARFSAADALLKVDTTAAVEKALAHFTDMLRLSRSDNMGVRDLVPSLMLRLGREQECYDFIKWYALIDLDGKYDWGNPSLPYLDIHGADPFEPVDTICAGNASLTHLAVLTLLKVRLHLDLDRHSNRDPYDDDDDFSLHPPPGRLAQARIESGLNVPATTAALERQRDKLCAAVNKANRHFWDLLVDDTTPVLPNLYSPGSIEQAHLALHQCQAAWRETEDADVMIDSNTVKYTRVHNGSVPNAGVGDTQWQGRETLQVAKMMEKRRAGQGTFPSQFQPPLPSSRPDDLFALTPAGPSQALRFVKRDDPSKFLVYTDGACANNGQANPRGGWAVVFGPGDGFVSSQLESRVPFGNQDAVATSNRAELRAAIAALNLSDWREEGFRTIVVATDSSYVIDGATCWAKDWVRNGWRTSAGGDVKNRDLWDLLLGEVERLWDDEMRVEFWKIPRQLNDEADAAAKSAANEMRTKTEFGDVSIPGTGSYVLTLCLEQESVFDGVHENLVAQITSKTKMERATTEEAALAILRRKAPPSVILVADGAITRNSKVREAVFDRLDQGATVVLAGCFSSMVTQGQFDRFFARLGLPWRRGSYTRTTVSLRRPAVHGQLASRLPAAYSQKATFAKNVAQSAVWYTPSESSGGAGGEAAVAFAKMGLGRLGYIGDVNGEESSDAVVLAMCGLLE